MNAVRGRLLALGVTVVLTSCVTAPHTEGADEALADATATARIKAALLDDAQTGGTSVEVKTFKGRAKLRGVVSSDAQARRATEIALSVPGVAAVDNAIEIKASQ